METYSTANEWGTTDDTPLVAGWDGKEGDGWWRAWSLDEVRRWTPIEIEIWRHGEDLADPEAYVIVNGAAAGLVVACCPTMGDALRCVTELMPLANGAALTELAGHVEDLVGLAKATLVDRGVPLPR